MLALAVVMVIAALTIEYRLVADFLVNQRLNAIEVATESAIRRVEVDLVVAQASVGRFAKEMSFRSAELS